MGSNQQCSQAYISHAPPLPRVAAPCACLSPCLENAFGGCMSRLAWYLAHGRGLVTVSELEWMGASAAGHTHLSSVWGGIPSQPAADTADGAVPSANATQH